MRPKDEDKIPRIYHAAIKVVNREGIEGCSMSKIAREASVSPATIYLYFQNKEDMMKKLFIHVKNRMGHSYFTDEMDLSVSKGTFRTIFINHYQYIINNIEEYVFLEDFTNSAQIAHIENEYRLDFCPVFESLFNRSKESGLLHDLHNDIIYSLLFAPLSYLVMKSKTNNAEINMHYLINVFEASWRAIVK
jgi:AcrR family transcriptional regulator